MRELPGLDSSVTIESVIHAPGIHNRRVRCRRGLVAACPCDAAALGADDDLKGVLSIDDVILWAIGRGGISATELAGALRRICAPRSVDEGPAVPQL